jgi:outer membrane murein-binding lipoprotein Lpp
MPRGDSHPGINVLRSDKRIGLVSMLSFAVTVVVSIAVSGCTRTITAPIPSDDLETTVPAGNARVAVLQQRVDSTMAALGDAYRQAIKDNEVTNPVIVFLGDGFSGAAREAEEANLRDAILSRNSLARTPGDPVLLVDIVTDDEDGCMIAEAEFDDRPLLAFPTAIQGISVVFRMRQDLNDELWRIDELITAQQADDNPIRCPLSGELPPTVPPVPSTVASTTAAVTTVAP